MLDAIKSIINNYNVSKVEGELLKSEYDTDRDAIIAAIKECIKDNDYVNATGLVDKYKPVAYKDPVFMLLCDEVKKRFKERLSREELMTRFELTPADDYHTRIEILNELSVLEPNNADYKYAIKEYKNALGLVPVISNDLRIGRIVSSNFIGYYPSQYPELGISNGSVTLRQHTHGISIKGEHNEVLRIHYSQIVDLRYVKDESIGGKLVGVAVGAAIGALFGDGLLDTVGCAAKGAEVANSTDELHIIFWDIRTDSDKELIIKGKSNEIQYFITRYNQEIEKTKRTGRQPQENDLFRKILYFLGGVLGFMIFCGACATCLSPSSSNHAPSVQQKPSTTVQEPVQKAQPAPSPSKGQNTQNDVDSTQWMKSGTSCSIQKSGTEFTVSGSSVKDSRIELTGIPVNSCGTVKVSFDKRSPRNIKCEKVSESRIRIVSNADLIKKMRNSSYVTVVVSDDTGAEVSTKYSLMGFSKACDWTK